ncbi:hypothetical protein SAMN06269185_0288 [Natronoarchaeum philippinense]|uniref:Uncharacterized protein n=1 Tax=Natronoarchaeum philippinense TaxID=558529 RepID=A0A285N208_NATPI|nr:hypothetical protein [Natronoarchaeum philippinense]SNZ03482.1 hypothetical protein SAMN06269185_0288 [Natronoarchaeum philippinense]
MAAVRTPPTAGIVASLASVVLVFAPFLALSGGEVSGLQTYYAQGVVGPWALAVLGLLSTVAFAAGREERSDPVTMAGATLVFGIAATMIALVWAVSVPEQLVQQIGTASWLAYHRWLLVVTAIGALVSSVWYVRALELF